MCFDDSVFFGSIRIFNFKIWLQWDDNSLLSFFFYFTIYDNELDFGWCLSPDGVVRFFAVSLDDDVDGSFVFWRSWYSWKHGTMHRLVWHSGQWYLVFRLRMRPWASIVFQQKLQPNAGPGRITGQCCERFSREISRNKCYMNKSNGKNFYFQIEIFD